MTIKDRLLEKFHDFAYRHAYVDEFTDAFIATQIKVIREQQDLTQVQLAEKAGMKQSQVSALEDVNNRSWKVRTLKKIARAFDLVLVVRFEPFGKVLPDIGRLDRATLERTSFSDDAVFSNRAATASSDSPSAGALERIRAGAVMLHAQARFGHPSTQFSKDVPNVA